MVGRPQRWLVCAALAGGKPLQLAAQARREESRGLVPWVGAAAPLPQLPASAAASSSAHRPSASLATEEGGSGSAMPSADDSTADSKAAGGRAFVFLPLPIATGLPLHVNGCFELSRWEASAEMFHLQLFAVCHTSMSCVTLTAVSS
jgi:sacsin